MHVPPGVLEEDGAARWLEEGYNQRLNQIITDNADVIIGIYSAHQHFDSFRLFYKENNDEHGALFNMLMVIYYKPFYSGNELFSPLVTFRKRCETKFSTASKMIIDIV